MQYFSDVLMHLSTEMCLWSLWHRHVTLIPAAAGPDLVQPMRTAREELHSLHQPRPDFAPRYMVGRTGSGASSMLVPGAD